ncbi:hypothetical protein CARUB_v10016505mg [Capsella rubella]|uniref:Uncharacterized protein n=1 Tax=Capsella rubella TaxID=81985 RepID=R0GJ83_9BRAS|nr:hypothetical protein CARUB_v10016505mg [Capsella rubella]
MEVMPAKMKIPKRMTILIMQKKEHQGKTVNRRQEAVKRKLLERERRKSVKKETMLKKMFLKEKSKRSVKQVTIKC